MLRPAVSLCCVLLLLVSTAARAHERVAHRLLAADRGLVVILNARGDVEWEVPNHFVLHDIAMLSNGNILMPTGPSTIVEVTPDRQIASAFRSTPKPGYTGAIEIHGFQRLPDGLTMIAESGNRRIIEVDREGKIVKEIALKVDRPDAHRDTRLARKLENGHYLVCHEGDGVVREYNPDGKVVWSYALELKGRPRSPGHGPEGHGTEGFGAIRLPNGNTMIAGGNNNRVFEVTRAGQIVWSIDQKELPGITLAWVTSLQYVPNGNLIFGNTHAGRDNPQLIEVTRDKKVVWTLKNWSVFGNDLCAAQVLDAPGKVIR